MPLLYSPLEIYLAHLPDRETLSMLLLYHSVAFLLFSKHYRIFHEIENENNSQKLKLQVSCVVGIYGVSPLRLGPNYRHLLFESVPDPLWVCAHTSAVRFVRSLHHTARYSSIPGHGETEEARL